MNNTSEQLLEAASKFIEKAGHVVTGTQWNEYGLCVELDGVERVIFRLTDHGVEMEVA